MHCSDFTLLDDLPTYDFSESRIDSIELEDSPVTAICLVELSCRVCVYNALARYQNYKMRMQCFEGLIENQQNVNRFRY
jgi:hypothetical protein